MLHTKLFKQDVTIQAILYILQKMGGVCDIHKCHKILYFADNEHLSRWGRSITGDTYIKMDFGPVPTCVYDLLKLYHSIHSLKILILQSSHHFSLLHAL